MIKNPPTSILIDGDTNRLPINYDDAYIFYFSHLYSNFASKCMLLNNKKAFLTFAKGRLNYSKYLKIINGLRITYLIATVSSVIKSTRQIFHSHILEIFAQLNSCMIRYRYVIKAYSQISISLFRASRDSYLEGCAVHEY